MYPILEHDPARDAVLEPRANVPHLGLTDRAVLCFFHEVLESLAAEGKTEVVHTLKSEIGKNPVYALGEGQERVLLVHPGVGAPLAAAFLEEVIALGCSKIIACGGAGVLDRAIARGHVVVAVSAVRDEGTSYHYLPPAREVAPHPAAVAAMEETLEQHKVPFLRGKAWTTDALYRETRAKIARRRAEGCVVVEMEAAALFAVGQFRGVTIGQLLYGGDDVSQDTWDHRHWDQSRSTREQILWLAVEACRRL